MIDGKDKEVDKATQGIAKNDIGTEVIELHQANINKNAVWRRI